MKKILGWILVMAPFVISIVFLIILSHPSRQYLIKAFYFFLGLGLATGVMYLGGILLGWGNK